MLRRTLTADTRPVALRSCAHGRPSPAPDRPCARCRPSTSCTHASAPRLLPPPGGAGACACRAPGGAGYGPPVVALLALLGHALAATGRLPVCASTRAQWSRSGCLCARPLWLPFVPPITFLRPRLRWHCVHCRPQLCPSPRFK